MEVSAINKFEQRIAARLGDDVHVSMFWKGRVAFYAILKAFGVEPGDEVVVPGFTCVVVANAIIYLGARPVYADIDPATYTVTRDTIEPKITERTKVIVTQNTYGLSPDMDPILDMAEGLGIEVVDDCTHGFGGTYKGKPNGSLAKASFFSMQWNKPFSTGVGGFTATKDTSIADEIRKIEREAQTPSAFELYTLRIMYLARAHLMTPSLYWKLLRLYRWMSRRGVVTGSSDSVELEGAVMPSGFVKKGSTFQARTGLRELKCFDESKLRRLYIADEYDQMLLNLGKYCPLRPDYAGHLFLKYPLRVRNRGELMVKAEQAGIPISDWFLSPLHPVEGDLSPWFYHYGTCPKAEVVSGEIVNLPTDSDMSRDELDRIKSFVFENRDNLV